MLAGQRPVRGSAPFWAAWRQPCWQQQWVPMDHYCSMGGIQQTILKKRGGCETPHGIRFLRTTHSNKLDGKHHSHCLRCLKMLPMITKTNSYRPRISKTAHRNG